MQKRYFLKSALLVAVVIMLYVAAVYGDLFSIFSWYDTLAHITGGLAIGYFVLAFVWKSSLTKQITTAASVAGVIGIAWEIFERVGYQIAPRFIAFGGTWDTIFDVFYAILGATFVVVLATTKRNNSR